MKTGNLDISTKHDPIVYLLWWGNELVYIGVTTDWTLRVRDHSKNKAFDKATYLATASKDECYWLEMKLIDVYAPEYNQTNNKENFNKPFPKGRKGQSKADLLDATVEALSHKPTSIPEVAKSTEQVRDRAEKLLLTKDIPVKQLQ